MESYFIAKDAYGHRYISHGIEWKNHKYFKKLGEGKLAKYFYSPEALKTYLQNVLKRSKETGESIKTAGEEVAKNLKSGSGNAVSPTEKSIEKKIANVRSTQQKAMRSAGSDDLKLTGDAAPEKTGTVKREAKTGIKEATSAHGITSHRKNITGSAKEGWSNTRTPGAGKNSDNLKDVAAAIGGQTASGQDYIQEIFKSAMREYATELDNTRVDARNIEFEMSRTEESIEYNKKQIEQLQHDMKKMNPDDRKKAKTELERLDNEQKRMRTELEISKKDLELQRRYYESGVKELEQIIEYYQKNYM